MHGSGVLVRYKEEMNSGGLDSFFANQDQNRARQPACDKGVLLSSAEALTATAEG
jgi:hypothetical protein